MELIKKASTYSFFVGIFLLTNVTSKGISISGNFKNTSGSKWIYIYQYLGNEIYKADSAKLVSGNIKYQGELQKGLYRLGISEEKSFGLVLGKEDLQIAADFANLATSVKIENSKENQLYMQYTQMSDKFNNNFARLDKEAQPILAVRNTDPQKFNSEIKKLQVRLDSMNKDRSRFLKKLSEDNKDLYIGKLSSAYSYDDNATKENFFSTQDLNDPELARSDALPNKIIIYLQKFAGQQLPQIQDEAAYLLGLAAPGSLNKEAFYISIIKIFVPYDLDYAKALLKMYVSEFPNSVAAAKLKSELPKGAPQIGDKAPDMTLKDPSGKSLSLSSLKGKIVLIDFWASWCGPCRMENPNVVKAYQKYKDKGFAIFSVSLDDNAEKWKQAITKDGLVWSTHVSDLKGWSSAAAQLYHVKGIPATFLIGKDGKIAGTNLRGEGLENKLAQLCK